MSKDLKDGKPVEGYVPNPLFKNGCTTTNNGRKRRADETVTL
jgi:hypothetical protein